MLNHWGPRAIWIHINNHDGSFDADERGDGIDETEYDVRDGDGKEELGEIIDLTMCVSDEKEANPGTRQWLMQNVAVGQQVVT